MKVVLQDGAKDCGICCLLSIIKYYDGKVSKEYLRQLTNTTKNGVSAYHLLQASKKLGFEAVALYGNLEQIEKEKLPCIAHVILNKSYHHFIVIYEINYEKEKLLIMDPSKGKTYLTFAEFKLMSSNNYIFLKPIQKLPLFNDCNMIKQISYKFIKENINYIVFLFFLTIFYFIFNVLSSYHFKYLIDYGINYHVSNNLFLLSITICSLYLLKEISSFLRKIILLKYSQLFDQSITKNTFQQLILLPYLYYKNRTTGEVVSRIKDLSVVKDYLTFILLFITTDLFSITIFILLLLKISKHLSLIALSLLVSFVIVSLVFKNIQKQKTKLLYQNEEQVNSYLIEALSSVDAIKGMHIEKSVIKRFMFKYKKFLAAIYSLSLTTEVITFLKNSLYSIFIVAILYCGSVEVIKNSLTLSDLIVFQSIFNFYIQSFQNLITLITKYPEYKVSTERIEDLFTIKKEAFQGNQYYKQYNLKGDIIYHDLTYAYNHKVLLNQINLVIHAKDKIFISGPSGAGKSTLVKLLMRYIEVPFQKISINGIDINHYHLNVIRQRITYVSQQEFLFNDTIYHNISLYQDCSKTEVEKVMNLALIDKEFSLDQTVEENGFNFSGGERQRLIIARSILKKSDIYIFDESFSQIDVVREKKILSNILNYLKEKTVIVISHRFDNKDLFDRILCLKNGKIYEEKL